MKRVAIFGSPGSGKSTLARRLSDKMGLPVAHLDTYYFNPGWVMKPADEFRVSLKTIVATDCWITDGNYLTESGPAGRIDRADTLILLNCPRWRCLWRVFRRSVLSYGRVRADQAAGCPERFDLAFWRFVWNFPAKTERIRTLLTGLADQKAVYFLNSPADTNVFISRIASEQTAASSV
ncbi:P-loop NTPase family protein [Spirosoma arcticum]